MPRVRRRAILKILIQQGRYDLVDLEKITPLVLYDDRCYLCTRFAGIAGAASGERLNLVGHYSATGEAIRLEFLDSDALDMFWFINDSTAYGGRAALLPLLRAVICRGPKGSRHGIADGSCAAGCRSPKSVFLRSASLLSNSRRIRL